jgi:hypothetical protein
VRTLAACLVVAAALGVGNAAQAKNDGRNCITRALDLAKMLGQVHGLAEASRFALWKIDTDPERRALIAYDIAEALRRLALEKQAEHDRELANYLAAGCK